MEGWGSTPTPPGQVDMTEDKQDLEPILETPEEGADSPPLEDVQRMVEPELSEPEPMRTPSGNIMRPTSTVERMVESGEALDLEGKDALSFRLKLDQMLNGMNSILDRMEENNEQARRLRDDVNRAFARIERIEQAAKSWEEDRKKWHEFTQERAERVDPHEAERARAKAMKDVQKAQTNVKARMAGNARDVRKFLEQFPKETIISPGVTVMVTGPGGAIMPKVMPEVLGYKGVQFRLPINEPIEVAKPLAEMFRSRRQQMAENEARKKLLSTEGGGMEDKEVAKEWASIDDRYQAPSVGFPVH